mgnify:FL=1
MTDLARLRSVLRGAGRSRTVPTVLPRARVFEPEAFAAALGGALEEGPAGPCPVVRSWFGQDGPYGERLEQASRTISVEGIRTLCGGGQSGQSFSLSSDPTAGLLFFDLETTGLSGGSGTVAFVVGFGAFEGSRFHIWQFVLPSFSGERQLLSGVAAVVSRAHTLVTFNGRSFDVPFLDTRWLYHRLDAPLGSLRHLDLLHVARRIWGPGTGGLGGLEDRVLDFFREGDVAGFEIPSRYFDYLRSGDPSPLRRVLLHNQLDLASLGVLAGLACDLIDQGPSSASDPRQCLGLGRLYERGGRGADAPACYEAAVAQAPGVCRLRDAAALTVQAEAFYRLALAQRRQRLHADEARHWQALLNLGRRPAGFFEREAFRALAVHYEHRLKDPERALAFARRANAAECAVGRRREAKRRLERLERQVTAIGVGSSPRTTAQR